MTPEPTKTDEARELARTLRRMADWNRGTYAHDAEAMDRAADIIDILARTPSPSLPVDGETGALVAHLREGEIQLAKWLTDDGTFMVNVCLPAYLGQAATHLERLSADLAKSQEFADKYKWQVRDTCVRALKAEADLDEARAKLVRIERQMDAFRRTNESLHAAYCEAIGDVDHE